MRHLLILYRLAFDLGQSYRFRTCALGICIRLIDTASRRACKKPLLMSSWISVRLLTGSHTKLLYKLHQHGITRNNFSWIKAFLLGRTQCVALEGEKSSEIPVTAGVPQGSVLGPILFLLYINDLPENIHSEIRLFAEDTVVYLTINSKADCQTLQQDRHKLEIWEKDWEMEFNPSKCQVLHITRARAPVRHQYVLHGQVLEAVYHAKYLGLEISHDLNWNTHIQNLTTKANRTLGFVRRNIQTKHQGIRQTAHNTLVRPQLEYASPVWSPYT